MFHGCLNIHQICGLGAFQTRAILLLPVYIENHLIPCYEIHLHQMTLLHFQRGAVKISIGGKLKEGTKSVTTSV